MHKFLHSVLIETPCKTFYPGTDPDYEKCRNKIGAEPDGRAIKRPIHLSIHSIFGPKTLTLLLRSRCAYK